MKYLKLWAQVVVTVAVALVAFLSNDNTVDAVEWVNVAIVAVGACAVFYGPNVPGAPITKAVLSALGAALTVLASAIVGGLQTVEIIQILIAAAGAVGVYALPNRGQTVSYDNTSVHHA